MLINIKEACDFLRGCGDTVIITHQYPDGDCIGAGFGLANILAKLGKRSRVICSEEFQKRYDYITSFARDYEDFSEQNVISVDLADVKLMGNLHDRYSDKVQLCIDHHISNTDYAEKTLLVKSAAATCEIIYDIAREFGVEIDEHFAASVYTGISTDTGCFKYENVTARTHWIASELMAEQKLRYFMINRTMFDVKSIGRIKMERIVTEHMEIELDGKLAIICITEALLKAHGLDINDLDGCSSIPLQVEGVEVGATVIEKSAGEYKVSMRSADSANVMLICKLFGGGGHAKAAGCNMLGEISDAKRKITEAVKEVLGL